MSVFNVLLFTLLHQARVNISLIWITYLTIVFFCELFKIQLDKMMVGQYHTFE